jgi:TonB family protein
MEHQTVLDAEARAKSFLQAKWFPGAIAAVALIIAIGGHTFTGWNSVNLAKMNNQVDGLEAFKATSQSSDSNQDRAIQGLQTDARNLQRTVQQLQAEVAELRKASTAQKRESRPAPATVEALDPVAVKQAEKFKAEETPLPTSVNERFDNLIRSRMKPYWEAPAVRPGEEAVNDKTMAILQFRVDRQGAVTDVQVANTSGHIEFDNAAIKAALKMDSIPEIAGLNNQAYAHVQNFRLAVSLASML